jgi:hypothetical protein
MLRELYRQKDLPVFQNRMYPTFKEARECPKGQMLLVEDLDSGLVRNASFDEKLVIYDEFYQNEQGNSPLFQSHLEDVASLVLSVMGSEELVEVGCGKGKFVELMLSRGADITGFDPAYEGASNRIRKVYFSEEIGIHARGLLLRHVLEHIADPVSFLKRLAKANGGQGLIYIEVPCFDWICSNRAWYDIFYEHVNYFRLQDFKRIFWRVLHADHTFGGQYLRIIADLSTLRDPNYDASNPVSFPSDFAQEQPFAKGRIKSDPIVVWGGASKGVIFSLLSERAGYKIDRVIDISPAKQGMYLPGTGLQVMSPKDGLSDLPTSATIWVMNPNYLPEIRQMAGQNFNYKVLSND